MRLGGELREKRRNRGDFAVLLVDIGANLWYNTAVMKMLFGVCSKVNILSVHHHHNQWFTGLW